MGACAQEDEIDLVPEVRPSITKAGIDTVKILPYNKTCIITVRFLDANGEYVNEKQVVFINQVDNPETPEDESTTEFTDFMQGLNINRVFLKNAIKSKLGIE
jgi:hypothetical protein